MVGAGQLLAGEFVDRPGQALGDAAAIDENDGGMALANAALGAVHGFAAPIGGMFDAPHGAVCAALLPHAMEANVRALRARAEDGCVVGRYETLARILTGNGHATAEDGVRWIAGLCRKLEIAPLRTYGVRAEHLAQLVDKAGRASSMKGNPVLLTAPELSEIVESAL